MVSKNYDCSIVYIRERKYFNKNSLNFNENISFPHKQFRKIV